MIIINNQKYADYTIDISWGNFSVHSCGIHRKGIAPFITFNIDDNIYIGLEFMVAKEMFASIKLNTIINIENYLSDITYEDELGWISLITGKYHCQITRIDDKKFNLKLTVNADEVDIINIKLDSDIILL